jgi:hypothetical protein
MIAWIMARQFSLPTVTDADFDLPLRAASVQAIQLELIRRTSLNAMCGDRVVESLFRHRDLWLAAILDRLGFCDYDRPRDLRPSALIKLRDLPQNYWNADTLYVVTKNVATARELARAIEAEDWAGEVQVHDDRTEVDRALGTGRDERAIVSVWWD